MPSIKDDSTVEAIAREFASNGRRKGIALQTVGYADSYSIEGGRGCDVVFHNVRVKAAIRRIDAKNEEKIEHTRNKSLQKLYLACDIAEDQRNPAGMVAAMREADDISGLKAVQPININTEINHATAKTEEQVLNKRIGLLKRMSDQPTGIERN